MKWKVSKDGNGVEINIDPTEVARIQREGIDWLSPVIFRMTPVPSVWALGGLQAPLRVGLWPELKIHIYPGQLDARGWLV